MTSALVHHRLHAQLPGGQVDVLDECIGNLEEGSVSVVDEDLHRHLGHPSVQHVTRDALACYHLLRLLRRKETSKEWLIDCLFAIHSFHSPVQR